MTYREFFRAMGRCGFLISLVTVLFSALFLTVTVFALPQYYESSAVFCIRNREIYENGITSTDISASETLVDASIVLMETIHDGEGALSFEKLGAGVFRLTVIGTDKTALTLSVQALADSACSEIPVLLNFASLACVAPIETATIPKNYVRNAVLGAVCGFSASAVGVLLLDYYIIQSKRKNRR